MKKGFTLVELLAVIVLLGLIIVVVATSGFGAFDKTKESINQIEEDNLLEAAKTYLVEIDNLMCGGTAAECTDKRNECKSECEINVGYLEDNGYFDDKKNKCDDGAIIVLKIEVDGDDNTTGYSATKLSSDAICVN